MTRGVLVAGVLGALAFTSLGAQRPIRPMGGGPPGAAGQDPRRAALEEEVRRRFAGAVQLRVGLTDDQMQRLGPLSRRFEEQRRQLQMEERETRLALQEAVRPGAAPDSAKTEQLLARFFDVQRRRVQLMESEQRELAALMTPIQRARYLAMQEQFRRRLEQLRPPMRGPFDGDFGPPGAGRRRPPGNPSP